MKAGFCLTLRAVWRLALLLVLAGAAVPAAADPFVECVQRQLLGLGVEPGPADGLMGPKTRRAWQ
ncbi:MAG: peptidoglycan-binding protein, partial [Leisingera sp.]